MNTREQLNQYLRGLESRLRILMVSRGIAVALGVALGATIALVILTNMVAFAPNAMLAARIVLYASLAAAIALGLVLPLLKLNERRAAGEAESKYPGFDQRLLTFVERRDANDPMLELLAEDTLNRAPDAPAEKIVPHKSIFAFGAGAGAAGIALLYLILAGPGFLGFGARTLWAGSSFGNAGQAFYSIIVEPGDALIRRGTDQSIVATLNGFMATEVRLLARYDSSARWEELVMRPRAGEASYGYVIGGVPEKFEYYVESNGVRSDTYVIDVRDLPSISNIKVTYHFPARFGLDDLVEDPGGDLRAVAGTTAELLVETDKPLENGVIRMQDGSEIELTTTEGNFLTANLPIELDGTYHFAAREGSNFVRLTPDYFIEAQPDEGPEIRITMPGPETQVNPIEEVVVAVQADDDFGITQLQLHYSVNGGEEQTVNLLRSRGLLTAEGQTTIYLEDFDLVPGDVVSLYATARDSTTETASDINFIQAVPFEKNYSQSQQGGGGGGGGGGGQQEQNEISRRQREIITLTNRALRGSAEDRSAATQERAEFLSEVQSTLQEQAQSLARRLAARQLDGANEEFEAFTREIELAAEEMGPAAELLEGQEWNEALQPELRALQHLQRAEQMNRDIQVAFGNQGGGGGGGGGGNAGRDLANLFDLELDTEQNQYEQAQTASGGGGGAEQQQQEIDEALQKLEELARRQQELAQQNQQNSQQSLDRRWEQERLRREAEELRRELEQLQQQAQQNGQRQSGQLSRDQQGQQSQGQQQGQQGQGQQGQQQGQQSGQGGQSAQAQQLQRMLDQVEQSLDDMRNAQSAQQQGNQAQADAEARRAAERLEQAGNIGNQMQRDSVTSGLNELERRADDLAERQRQMERQLEQAYGTNNGPGLSQQERERLAAEKDALRNEVQALERDAQSQARELSQTQPDASRMVRDGLSEVQQAEAARRLEYGADYIRQGNPSTLRQWTQLGRETPITESLERMASAVQEAQGALREGNQQAAADSELERQINQVAQLRQQLEQARAQAAQQGQGQQGGQQQGQQGQGQQGQQGQGQQGQQGQGQQGQQQGQGQQGGQQGGQQQGGQQGGGANDGPNATSGGFNGGQFQGGNYGRYNPQGFYDNNGPLGQPVDPQQAAQDARRGLAELRQFYQDNPDMANQIGQVERALQELTLGNPSGPELNERLSRTILPQIESLEVQLRRELAEQEGGQVRSAATDKVPAGLVEQVQEYFRRLSR